MTVPYERRRGIRFRAWQAYAAIDSWRRLAGGFVLDLVATPALRDRAWHQGFHVGSGSPYRTCPLDEMKAWQRGNELAWLLRTGDVP